MAKPIISPNAGYNLSITGKHFQITDAIRNYVFEKLEKVDRIADRVIDVNVILDAQKLEHSCSVHMDFIHFHIKVQASTENMYSAIDRCMDRLNKLIRRYKTKLQSRRFKDLTTVDIHVNVIKPLEDNLKIINEDIEAQNAQEAEERFKLHEIVAKETMSLKTLTQEEAVMKMEISDDVLLIFRSEEDHKIKVIYRRPDSNYGLVQVQ